MSDYEAEDYENPASPTPGSQKRKSGDLYDIDNDGSDKKRRTDDLEQSDFTNLMQEAGCDVSRAHQGTYSVDDPRQMVRLLEQKLTLNASLCKSFLDGLEEHMEPMEVLHAALRPMTVLDMNVPVTGESFIHALLGISAIQRQLSESLLVRLCEFCNSDGDDNSSTTSIPQLILGQFRWLHTPLDGRFLTEKIIEVLPAMPTAAQHDALALLEEVAEEDDFQSVVDAVSSLVQDEISFLVPAFKALNNMAQGDAQKNTVVELVVDRFGAASLEDLAAVVGFLIQQAGSGKASTTATLALKTVRERLHFVTPSDPRLVTPDRKQKGALITRRDDDPESQVLEAMRQSFQLSGPSADALLKAVDRLNRPEDHRVFDFWSLMVVASFGPDRSKVVEALIVKKLKDGSANASWLEKSVKTHKLALQPLFSTFLSLSQKLVRSPQEAVATAGASFYSCLFIEFNEPYNRQETLRTLHSHFGSHSPQEVSSAMGVLKSLAISNAGDLLQQSAFVGSVLDFVDKYAQNEAALVFEVFAELVAGACEQRDAEDGNSTDNRSRLEDELFVFLRKQLTGVSTIHRRIGVIGTVALVKRLAGSAEQGGAVGEKYKEAIALLESAIGNHIRHPATFAMLCDEMSRVVSTLPRQLMMDVSTQLKEILEIYCMETISMGNEGRAVPVSAWAGLNGGELADIAMRLLPYDTDSDLDKVQLPPGVNASDASENIIITFSLVRLICSLDMAVSGNLDSVDAILGSPLMLTHDEYYQPNNFTELDTSGKRCVLLGLFYTLNWCRELITCFSPLLATQKTGELECKVLSRTRAAAQLDAMLRALLHDAPPLFTLPCLGAVPSNAVSAAPKIGAKPKKKKAAATKKKKKKTVADDDDGVAMEEDEDEVSKTVSHTTSTKAGGAGTNKAAVGYDVALERSTLRPLPPCAFAAITAGTSGDEMCYSALPAAQYMLEDLYVQLTAALAAKKKVVNPFFNKSASAAAATTASATEILAALNPLFPALRKHFDCALHVVDVDLTEDYLLKEEHRTVWSALFADKSQPMSLDKNNFLATVNNELAEKAVAIKPAGLKLISLVLNCLDKLLKFPDISSPEYVDTLKALLVAFEPASDSPCSDNVSVLPDINAEWSKKDLFKGLKLVFKYLNSHLPDCDIESESQSDDGAGSMDRWLHILKLQDSIIALQARIYGDSTVDALKSVTKLKNKVSATALHLLKQPWDDGSKTGAWKAANVSEAIHLHLSNNECTKDAIKKVIDLLNMAPPKTPVQGDEDDEVEFPSYTIATQATWYDAVWKEIVRQWNSVLDSVASASQMSDLDEETITPIIQGLLCWSSLTQAMALILKIHDVQKMNITAFTQGFIIIDSHRKTEKFWSLVYDERLEEYKLYCNALQKVVTVLGTLCAESKARSDDRLTSLVPKVKRACEKFVFSVAAFMDSKGAGNALKVGDRKLRDLKGRAVPSQLHPAQDSSEDEEEEEEEEEEYNDEYHQE